MFIYKESADDLWRHWLPKREFVIDMTEYVSDPDGNRFYCQCVFLKCRSDSVLRCEDGCCSRIYYVSVRAGYRYGGNSPVASYASLGAGVKLLGIRLDAAYLIGSGPMKNTLAISLGYSF